MPARGLLELPAMVQSLSIEVPGPGLHEITDRVHAAVSRGGVAEGVCTLFIRHTSASLAIQENADPSARRDLEGWLERLVPPEDPHFTHTAEGPDDMPSHIKAALTSTSLSIPIIEGGLGLGTWQGIFIWEHRTRARTRIVLVACNR